MAYQKCFRVYGFYLTDRRVKSLHKQFSVLLNTKMYSILSSKIQIRLSDEAFRLTHWWLNKRYHVY